MYLYLFILIFNTKRVLQMTYEPFLMCAQVAYEEAESSSGKQTRQGNDFASESELVCILFAM